MLGAGQHRGRVRQRLALVAAHPGGGQHLAEVGVFAVAFDDPPPAGVPGNVHHRGERPADAFGGRLDGGHAGAILGDLGVPGGSERQGHRIDRAVAVDHVEGKEDGDFQPRFLHGLTLQFVDRPGARQVEDRTDAAPRGQFVLIHLDVVRPGGHAAGELRQLAELFLQRHLLEQSSYLVIDLFGIHKRRRRRRKVPRLFHFDIGQSRAFDDQVVAQLVALVAPARVENLDARDRVLESAAPDDPVRRGGVRAGPGDRERHVKDVRRVVLLAAGDVAVPLFAFAHGAGVLAQEADAVRAAEKREFHLGNAPRAEQPQTHPLARRDVGVVRVVERDRLARRERAAREDVRLGDRTFRAARPDFPQSGVVARVVLDAGAGGSAFLHGPDLGRVAVGIRVESRIGRGRVKGFGRRENAARAGGHRQQDGQDEDRGGRIFHGKRGPRSRGPTGPVNSHNTLTARNPKVTGNNSGRPGRGQTTFPRAGRNPPRPWRDSFPLVMLTGACQIDPGHFRSRVFLLPT